VTQARKLAWKNPPGRTVHSRVPGALAFLSVAGRALSAPDLRPLIRRFRVRAPDAPHGATCRILLHVAPRLGVSWNELVRNFGAHNAQPAATHRDWILLPPPTGSAAMPGRAAGGATPSYPQSNIASNSSIEPATSCHIERGS
jgi:hypothetical protein